MNLARTLVVGWYRGVPLKFFFICAVIRVFLGGFYPRQIQLLCPSTRATYKSWIRQKASNVPPTATPESANRLKPEIVPLPDGKSSLLWVGNRALARKVILFFHGGGYISPLVPGHLEWCWRAYVEAGIACGVETAVAVLEYTLCPAARFPDQLRQAVAGLERLLADGVRPGDIIIGGDSAGGNLTAQLLCLLNRPLPGIRAVQLAEPLTGSFLVSPWVSEKTTDRSFRENHALDMLSAGLVTQCGRTLLGPGFGSTSGADIRHAAFPLDGDGTSFDGMDSVVREIYVTAGEFELFRDQSVAVASELRSRNPRLVVRLDVFPKLAHDFILLEGRDGIMGTAMSSMREWMVELLTKSKGMD